MGKIASDHSKTATPMEFPSSSAASSPAGSEEDGRSRWNRADLEKSGTGDDHFTTVPVEIDHPHHDYFRTSSNCVKFGYDDIFVEPASIRNGIIGKHLSPRLNKVFGYVFHGTQEGLYFFLSMITGIFAGCCWGASYALFIYADVWFIRPINVLILGIMHSIVVPLVAAFRSLLDPVFQSCGQVFASITVNARLRMLHSLRTGPEAVEPRRGMVVSNLTRYDSRTSDWLGFV